MQAQRSQSLSDLNLYLVIGAHAALFAGFSLAAPLVLPEVPVSLKVWGLFLATGIVTWSTVLVAGALVKGARALGLTASSAQPQLEDAETALPTPAATHSAVVIAEKRRAELLSSATAA